MNDIAIRKVAVMVGRGADKIVAQTYLPCGTWPYEGYMSFNFEVAAGQGVDYVVNHFDIHRSDIDIVDLS